MNCTDIQNRILLAHSGELPDAEAAELRAHLAGCEPCRKSQAGLSRMLARAHEALPAGNPSPAVMNAILREARAAGTRRRHWQLMLRAGLPLAAAAALLILAGGRFLTPHPEASGSRPLDGTPDNGGQAHGQRIEEVHAILAMVGEKQVSEPARTGLAGAEARHAAIRELALDLLKMEGLHVEETMGLGSATQPGEPVPTTFRSRSTAEVLPERCG